MRIVCIIALSLATLFTGCADHVTDNDNLGVSTNPLTENGPEAIGLLTFLNHPETTLDVLDHKVPLNRRAARNLIHHRDGWDKEPGTFDDNLFDTVAEVDAVPWIGPATMERLVHYVLAEGWVPQGDDILGVWDGVSFTVKEAQRTLDFVNKASHDLLDDGLRLDKRAADSIMEAQPIESIGELADLYYVGGSALKRLKQTANETAGTVYQDQFNHDEVEEIPDASGAGVDTNVHVVGVPDIMVDVVAKIHLMHDAPEEVQLKLRSPNGSTWSINAKGPATTLPIGPMAKPNGLWSLNAVDPVKGNIGELYGWLGWGHRSTKLRRWPVRRECLRRRRGQGHRRLVRHLRNGRSRHGWQHLDRGLGPRLCRSRNRDHRRGRRPLRTRPVHHAGVESSGRDLPRR